MSGFSTRKLIEMGTRRAAMLENALATGDFRGTTFTKREHIEQALVQQRESLAALKARGSEPCYYCGLPTRDGECFECGTVPSMLA